MPFALKACGAPLRWEKGEVCGKAPSSSPPVIKMDAIYFFWHSNYIDVCRQLFQHGAFFQLPFLLSHLTLSGHKSGRAWVGGIVSWGASQVSGAGFP